MARSLISRTFGPVHARDWGGGGIPILLAHGMAAHAHWWDAVVPLWKGALHGVALDFRGHGDSDWLDEGQAYVAERYVEDIETARRELGWERFVLAGHSMGARIALDYAARHGERLHGLAAIDFLVDFNPSSDHKFGKAQTRGQPLYATEEDMLSKFRLQPRGTLLDEAALKELGRHGVRRGPAGWSWKFDWRSLSFPYGSVWPQLAGIAVDALIVRGEHSPILTRADMEKVAARMPRARALEIAGAHHHIPLDKPRELADALARFAVEWTSGR